MKTKGKQQLNLARSEFNKAFGETKESYSAMSACAENSKFLDKFISKASAEDAVILKSLKSHCQFFYDHPAETHELINQSLANMAIKDHI